MVRFFSIVIFFTIFYTCKPVDTPKIESTPGEISSLDFSIISNKLVDLAELQEGERVLLVMAPGAFNPIIKELANKIKLKKAIYLGTISVTENQPEEWNTKFTIHCADKSATELKEIFKEVDLGIMLPGANTTHLPYKALQDILQEGIRRTIHFHWAGAYDLNGNLVETDHGKGLFYQDVILNTDYPALSDHQDIFEKAMRDQVIYITTPEGTNLQFKIGDRPVTKQNGNASSQKARLGKNLIDREIEIPSGAIRVAPIEETVNGKIAFPDADWNGQRVENLVVTINNGIIDNIAADTNKEAVEAELAQAGKAGRSFREFALGFNPMMPIQTGQKPWIPYYGYGAGIVRLSLGDNSELGGKVGGGYVRWNFFTNATVRVGDVVWVKDGELSKEHLLNKMPPGE